MEIYVKLDTRNDILNNLSRLIQLIFFNAKILGT